MKYLLIEPFCHITVSKNHLIAFNELEGVGHEFKVDTAKLFQKKINGNRYISLTDGLSSDQEIRDVINSLVNMNCAVLFEEDEISENAFVQQRELFLGEDIFNVDNEFETDWKNVVRAVYLLGSISDNNSLDLHRQIPYPVPGKKLSYTPGHVENFLKNFPYDKSSIFFIVSSDLREIMFLFETLTGNYIPVEQVVIKIRYNEYISNKDKLPKGCKFEVLIPPGTDLSLLKAEESIKYIVLVENSSDLEKVSKLGKELPVRVIPFYNKSIRDSSFFVLNKKEIFSKKQSIKKIQFNKLYNSALFGIIYIMPNGEIMDSPNGISIGELENFSLIEAKKHLFNKESAWMTTRSDVDSCSSCNYKEYCPPISEYERCSSDYEICRGAFCG